MQQSKFGLPVTATGSTCEVTTCAHIPVWNCCSMAIKVGGQPNLLRMSQRSSQLTVSNAFLRSAKDMHKSWRCSQHFSCSCRATNILSIWLRLHRNPHWDSGKTRSTTCSRRLVSMTLTSTLPDTDRREMPHSARSLFCLYTGMMLAFFHCCGRYLADQQSRIKLCSLLC